MVLENPPTLWFLVQLFHTSCQAGYPNAYPSAQRPNLRNNEISSLQGPVRLLSPLCAANSPEPPPYAYKTRQLIPDDVHRYPSCILALWESPPGA